MPIGCYVINLDRSPDRLEHFCLQAAKEGLEFQRIPAVDGSRLDRSTMDRLLSIGSGYRRPSLGEMGCYLSHRRAWTRLLRDEFETGFIAEDDAHLANASRFLLTSEWLPAEFDLIKADTSRFLCEFSVNAHSTHYGHTLRRPKSFHPGTVGYVISRRGAIRLLEATEELCDAIDDIMFDPRLGIVQSLVIYQLDPAICVEDGLICVEGRFPRHDGGKSSFKSTIGPGGKLLGKPSGIAKIWREVSRPFSRLYYRIECTIKAWRGISHFKSVRFAGDD